MEQRGEGHLLAVSDCWRSLMKGSACEIMITGATSGKPLLYTFGQLPIMFSLVSQILQSSVRYKKKLKPRKARPPSIH